MQICIIVAMGRDRAIGGNNQLLWHLPEDLKRFKRLTTGHTILMGRNTWESLPNGALPNRRNVVVSRTLTTLDGGAEVYPSLELALAALSGEDKLFVIGGGQIYEQLLPLATKLYLTIVEEVFAEADTYFPEIDWQTWNIEQKEFFSRDERNSLDSVYIEASRKKIT